MRFTSLGLVLCMLPFLVGCGDSGSKDSGGNDPKDGAASQDSGTDNAASQADASDKTTVKLLDPGTEPRTALRYKFQGNRNEKMVMDINMAVEVEGQPDMQMPTTRMTMTIETKEVSPEGDLDYDVELAQAEVLSKPSDNSMIVDMMKQQLNSMQGLSGSATVTSRGITKEAEVKLPAGIDAQSKQVMDNMRQQMNQMSAPLPEEPVGKGARWQVTMPMETPAMKVTQIATYTLSEIQGDKVKCDVTIAQSAPPQEIEAPGAAAGMKLKLESLDSSGTGTVEMQMTDLVPTVKLNLRTTNVVLVGEKRMKQTMRITTDIHP